MIVGAAALVVIAVVIVAAVLVVAGRHSTATSTTTTTIAETTTTTNPLPSELRSWYATVSPTLQAYDAAATQAKNAAAVKDVSAECIADAQEAAMASREQSLTSPPNAELAVRWGAMTLAAGNLTNALTSLCSDYNSANYIGGEQVAAGIPALTTAENTAVSDFQATFDQLTSGG